MFTKCCQPRYGGRLIYQISRPFENLKTESLTPWICFPSFLNFIWCFSIQARIQSTLCSTPVLLGSGGFSMNVGLASRIMRLAYTVGYRMNFPLNLGSLSLSHCLTTSKLIVIHELWRLERRLPTEILCQRRSAVTILQPLIETLAKNLSLSLLKIRLRRRLKGSKNKSSIDRLNKMFSEHLRLSTKNWLNTISLTF